MCSFLYIHTSIDSFLSKARTKASFARSGWQEWCGWSPGCACWSSPGLRHRHLYLHKATLGKACRVFLLPHISSWERGLREERQSGWLRKSTGILFKAGFVPLAVCWRGAGLRAHAVLGLQLEQPFMNEAPEGGGGISATTTACY